MSIAFQNDAESWLRVARRLEAIAYTGLLYTENGFDKERYEEIQKISLDVLARGAGVTPGEALDYFSERMGHPTPKTDVRSAVFDGDRILLVRGSDDGLWTLPGGWAEIGETPAESAAREVLEESGFTVRPTKLIGLFDRDHQGHPARPFACYMSFFMCEILSGEPRPSIETTEVAFFGEQELPPLSILRITPAEIAVCFEHHRDPMRPTDFD